MQTAQHPILGERKEVFSAPTRQELRAAMDARKAQLQAQGYTGFKRTKISRNAPCPCGSGVKAKRCCIPKGITHAVVVEK